MFACYSFQSSKPADEAADLSLWRWLVTLKAQVPDIKARVPLIIERLFADKKKGKEGMISIITWSFSYQPFSFWDFAPSRTDFAFFVIMIVCLRLDLPILSQSPTTFTTVRVRPYVPQSD